MPKAVWISGQKPSSIASNRFSRARLLLTSLAFMIGSGVYGTQAPAPDYIVHLNSGQTWPGGSTRTRIDAGGALAVILLSGSVTGARINPVDVVGPYRAIETTKSAMVTNLIVDGLKAEVLRECFRVRGTRITVRNVHCTQFEGPRTRARDLPEGLHIEEGSDITVENSSFDGFQYIMPETRYWNGDGVAAERPVTGLVIRDVSARDNTDAGFDIKAPVTMDRVLASGNCRNFRFWSDTQVGTMTVGRTLHRGGRSSCAGIWIKGNDQIPPHIKISRLVVQLSGGVPLILVQDGRADIEISECEIKTPGPLAIWLEKGGTSVHLGHGCGSIVVARQPEGGPRRRKARARGQGGRNKVRQPAALEPGKERLLTTGATCYGTSERNHPLC